MARLRGESVQDLGAVLLSLIGGMGIQERVCVCVTDSTVFAERPM